jgi:hypothetical protein
MVGPTWFGGVAQPQLLFSQSALLVSQFLSLTAKFFEPLLNLVSPFVNLTQSIRLPRQRHFCLLLSST